MYPAAITLHAQRPLRDGLPARRKRRKAALRKAGLESNSKELSSFCHLDWAPWKGLVRLRGGHGGAACKKLVACP